MAQGSRLRDVIRFAMDRMPYLGALRQNIRDAGAFPAGHFYSPIPTGAEVHARLQLLESSNHSIPGIDLNIERQLELIRAFRGFYADLPFPEKRTTESRYFFDQTVFCYADAIFLYSFLRHTQPKRIIEVGSGFSSAVMLDTIDRFCPQRPEVTFIEPYPVNLMKILRPRDYHDITVVEDKVQNVPLDAFRSLQTGDLLFIDSSHVLKCGSDLQFLMFEVLPQLPVGIYVHFHDVFDPFEYPPEWLLKGWYWNEAYMLRAFLAHNAAWEICLFGNYAVTHFAPLFAETMPLCLKNAGGSLYLRRTA